MFWPLTLLTRPKPCRFCEALHYAYGEENVLEENRDGTVSVGGNVLTAGVLAELKGNVVFFKRSGVFSLLHDTMRKRAIDIGMVKSKDYDQLLVAKAMLYVIEDMERTIALIEKAKEPSQRL